MNLRLLRGPTLSAPIPRAGPNLQPLFQEAYNQADPATQEL